MKALVGLYAKISTSSKTLDRVAQYAGLDEKGRIAPNSRVAVDFDKDGQYEYFITADTENEALKLMQRPKLLLSWQRG